MTDPRWMPCEVGEPLAAAMEAEGKALPDALFTAATRPAWFRWETHRDGCELCRSYKETK